MHYKKKLIKIPKSINSNDYQLITTMSNLEANYELILTELRKQTKTENFYFKPIKPKLSDIKLVSLVFGRI